MTKIIFKDKEPKETTYKIGDWFANELNEVAQIAQVESGVINLILSNGNRYYDQIDVGDSNSVTKDEFLKLTLNNNRSWRKVEVTITVEEVR